MMAYSWYFINMDLRTCLKRAMSHFLVEVLISILIEFAYCKSYMYINCWYIAYMAIFMVSHFIADLK